jgi:outer membrane lipase/esterase
MGTVESRLAQLGFELNVVLFDTFALLERLIDDPGAFGFSNVTTPCLATPDVLTGCQGYLFFDGVHPTTAGHQIVGQFFAVSVPEPSTALLVLAGVAGLALGGLGRRA